MKTKKFYDINHAQRYMLHTIVRVKGEPRYVTNVEYKQFGAGQPAVMAMWHCKSTEAGMVHWNDCPVIAMDDPTVDMNPVPLGFVNFKKFGNNAMLRTWRRPSREWHVGLASSALMTDNADYPGRAIMTAIGLVNCIKGVYPKLEEVIKAVKKNPLHQEAFSRKFGLKGNLLMYLNLDQPVGEVYNDQLALLPQCGYLTELLREELHAY